MFNNFQNKSNAFLKPIWVFITFTRKWLLRRKQQFCMSMLMNYSTVSDFKVKRVKVVLPIYKIVELKIDICIHVLLYFTTIL